MRGLALLLVSLQLTAGLQIKDTKNSTEAAPKLSEKLKEGGERQDSMEVYDRNLPSFFLHPALNDGDKEGVAITAWHRDIHTLRNHPSRIQDQQEAKFVLVCCLQRGSVRKFANLPKRSHQRPYLIRTIVPHGETVDELFGQFIERDDFLYVNYDMRDSMHWAKNKLPGVTMAPHPVTRIPKVNLDSPKYFLTFRGRNTHTVREQLGRAFKDVIIPEGVQIPSDSVKVEVIYRPKHDYVVTGGEHKRFQELSDTAYMLLPRGKEKWSYRFTEAIQACSIPVVMSDGMTMPYEEMIDWTDAAIFVKESLADDAQAILAALPKEPAKIKQMRTKVCELRDKYFNTDGLRAEAMIKDAVVFVDQRNSLSFVRQREELAVPEQYRRRHGFNEDDIEQAMQDEKDGIEEEIHFVRGATTEVLTTEPKKNDEKKRSFKVEETEEAVDSGESDEPEENMFEDSIAMEEDTDLKPKPKPFLKEMKQSVSEEAMAISDEKKGANQKVEDPAGSFTTSIKYFRGRLGNNLIQLQNALLFAEATGRSQIHIPQIDKRGEKVYTTDIWEFLNRPEGDVLKLKNEAVNFHSSCMTKRFKPSDVFFDDFFTHGGRVPCVDEIKERSRVLLKYIKPMIKVQEDKNKLADDELVIHMRSGDLMTVSMEKSSESRQPPCAFYDKIILEGNNGTAFKNVRIITQKDGKNPCPDQISAGHFHDKKVVIQNLDRNADAAALMNAKNLVLSTSTFPLMMGMMNENLEQAWYPKETLSDQALPCGQGYAKKLFQVTTPGLEKNRPFSAHRSWMKKVKMDTINIKQC